uniref:Galectin n=1 Tax=Strongyloides papillosus TaxID=174720 RepID=A0A0N5BV04_STREA
MHTIHNPVVPFVQTIYEELRPGARIIVEGHVAEHHDHAEDFAIELLSGPHAVLHINFRFHHGPHKEHKLVLNNCINGSWGIEVRHTNPLHNHDRFTIIIMVHETHYTIDVNGYPVGSYKHMVDYRTVQAIGIKGHVSIEKVRFEGFSFCDTWGYEYDYGHSGYQGYGTDYYVPPEFRHDHPYRHHFHN